MGIFRAFLTFIFIIPIFVSCGNNNGEDGADSLSDSANYASVNVTSHDSTAMDITVKTFIVKDSADKQKGWGYDLYVDGKRTITQPLIPAVPGNDAFATEEDAKKTGELALQKMKLTGSFPTISIHDLDSLGIKHK